MFRVIYYVSRRGENYTGDLIWSGLSGYAQTTWQGEREIEYEKETVYP